jgi:hypothetical protein
MSWLNEEECFRGGAGSIDVKGCGYQACLSVRGTPRRGSAGVAGISNSISTCSLATITERNWMLLLIKALFAVDKPSG